MIEIPESWWSGTARAADRSARDRSDEGRASDAAPILGQPARLRHSKAEASNKKFFPDFTREEK
ncbi:hypothetical protein [Methylobacterium nonmethylotrophicum]|uniref:Uncharacterized protein n=1 Tax=Methylobacterium nonmethylotrophicum TaxID=1141884 RepID=A0A4Z0NV18_9HYPH|nr:hypothetical protein [Methylobacterium nonmethylotrophicum]TGE01123.1 hypothetical protein EU555_05830 [Methylobacterium nonmethylotrophicum]